ncbi:hypothetical protein AXF42_Ash016924 [Apostasia shenzhenica]|uniref:Uncharacterized protein n=1 Tax=Apostasia shenzhenica TaxID=1088818 RepID=A0A2H9ZRJ3_9ASPA|nr:hypothetical protein AXF42_Ash016924 [Apostasia shenzhenica]
MGEQLSEVHIIGEVIEERDINSYQEGQIMDVQQEVLCAWDNKAIGISQRVLECGDSFGELCDRGIAYCACEGYAPVIVINGKDISLSPVVGSSHVGLANVDTPGVALVKGSELTVITYVAVGDNIGEIFYLLVKVCQENMCLLHLQIVRRREGCTKLDASIGVGDFVHDSLPFLRMPRWKDAGESFEATRIANHAGMYQ